MALVVTIIVLLILAGITIILVLGDNGVIKRAKDAHQTHSEESIRERMNLAYHSALVEGQGKVTEDVLKDSMKIEFKDKLVNNELPSGWLIKPSPEDENKWRIIIDNAFLDVPAGTSSGDDADNPPAFPLVFSLDREWFFYDEGMSWEEWINSKHGDRRFWIHEYDESTPVIRIRGERLVSYTGFPILDENWDYVSPTDDVKSVHYGVSYW